MIEHVPSKRSPRRSFWHTSWPVLSLGLLSACVVQGESPAPEVEVSVQELRVAQSGARSALGMDILTTSGGRAIPCNEGHLQVSVGVSTSPEGPFEELPEGSYEIRCTSDESADVALVVDNSGSEEGYLPWLQEAAHVMADELLARDGRASLVRVSTDSSVLLPLTGAEAVLRDAIDELFIRNGWTALYDGIRMGNETLGDAVAARTADPAPGELCSADRKLGVVAFTDGRENNSAHQRYQSAKYPGDGIDTTLEDLHGLAVDGVTTPIYTVGLGDEVDHAGLAELAARTGGRHHRVDDETDLPEVFQVISDYLSSSVEVCTELPSDLCGDQYVRVEYTWTPCDPADETCEPEQEVRGSFLHEIHVECPPAPAAGKAATVLLTLSNPGIDRDTARTLASNAARWVSAVPDPRVLVVKDDNHHGEFEHDAAYVHEILNEAGVDAEFIDEPRGGLTLDHVVAYDVVWFSNPGYAPDDKTSVRTLEEFTGIGGGYVLQSDDASWFFGDNAFSMTPYTGLTHFNNGTYFCDRHIDNNATRDRYEVVIDAESHPVIAGLEGAAFFYGDDIDSSAPAGLGEEVLAWAGGADASGERFCDKQVPVIVVRTP